MRFIFSLVLSLFSIEAFAAPCLELDVISYEGLVQNDPESIRTLRKAFFEKGIGGIRGVPGFEEKVAAFIKAARLFASLPDEVKEKYCRKPGELFLGYELGKEKFKRPDGTWVVDDQKGSYYAFVPDAKENKWPTEFDLCTPYQEIGTLMRKMGMAVMEKIGLTGPATGISVENQPSVSRMLIYRGKEGTFVDNPFWCGAHFDHGLFTTLLPSFYFLNGEEIEEPEEAGLYVRVRNGEEFQKVAADPGVLMFQAAEFGQLATDDAVRATEHWVQKANRPGIERYTMATFFDAPMQTVVHSRSELVQDTRYGGGLGDPCTYLQWHEASFKRYISE